MRAVGRCVAVAGCVVVGVLVFCGSAFAALPAAETGTAAGISETAATLRGAVNPNGAETKYFFEYGTTAAYGSKTVEASVASGAGVSEVSAEIIGLSRSAVYHFRIVATNASGTADGADKQFMTRPVLVPWWGVSSGSRPTALQVGFAKSEVQEIVTSREAGFLLRVNEKPVLLGENEGIYVTEPFFKELGETVPLASAANIQKALEGVAAYGPGTVVSGGPLEEGKPLVVTAPVGRPVPKLEVGALLGEAEARIVSEGRADGQVIVTAQNLGDAATKGMVTVSDRLPAGFRAVAIEGVAGGPAAYARNVPKCTLGSLSCTFDEPSACSKGEFELGKCALPPFEEIELRISVVLEAGAKSGVNTATVSGGGATEVTGSHVIEVGGPMRFGIEDWEQVPEKAGGLPETQAGSHPFQLTSVVTLNSQRPDSEGRPRTVALPKNIVGELPPGLIGNPTPFAQCTDAQFAAKIQVKEPHGEGTTPINECPADSVVGVATVTVNEPGIIKFNTVTDPIFNMVPRTGEPVRFGFKPGGVVSIFLDASIRTGGDYGANVGSYNTSQIAWVLTSKLTFWGVPGATEHDHQRGWDCLLELGGPGACPTTTPISPPPFLVMPTSCGPLESTLTANSWAASGKPSETAEPASYTLPEAVDGCNHLPFSPEIKVTPDGTAASSPTGLNVDVHVPQNAVLNAESLAESAVKSIEVALPPGVEVNPAGGDGLQACTEGEVGYLPPPASEPPEHLHFTPTLPEVFCPNASKIATFRTSSPLLPKGQYLNGAVYLATQNANPFGSLIAMYIVAEDPISGVMVKLPGETHLTASGQLVGVFKDTPQLAFEDAELHFFGGERAPLSSPAHCGLYTTNAKFEPWSGNEPATAASTFAITSGPNGSPCPGPALPFNPALTGGTTNINAGAFSPLTTTIGREDGNQDMQSVTLHMPLGIEGLLSGVKLCPEAQANEGTCGPESQIGETTVSAGVGSDPVSVKGGKVYITEKYAGAPFGLSIVNPVKAGPFDLERDTSNPAQNPPCDCVVVRARLEVDPRTAQLTVTTDESGPHAIPHMIDGIPVQIKKVNVIVNREHFTFNPTNCNPQTLTGTIASDEGASSPVSVLFQATNCAILKFTPKVTVSTAAKFSRVNGASVNFKISYPPNPVGNQSWLNEVKFDIPKQLPARLTTLQKACLATVFEHDRPACPPASLIAHAVVHTPVLPVPLEGPVYFVSYGGAKFPDAVLVLQGYGITLESHGETFIKNGVTSATFRNIPDAPVESIEVNVPAGPHSEFAANLPAKAKNTFCGQKLTMPTLFKAQNGLEIHQTTPIQITGCPKPKHKPKARKAHNTTNTRQQHH